MRRNIIICLLIGMIIAVSGCLSVDLDTMGFDDGMNIEIKEDFAYDYLFRHWWCGVEPQDILNRQVKLVETNVVDGVASVVTNIDRRAIKSINVERTWLQATWSIGSFGIYAPFTVVWRLESKCKKCYPNTCGCYENGCNNCGAVAKEVGNGE